MVRLQLPSKHHRQSSSVVWRHQRILRLFRLMNEGLQSSEGISISTSGIDIDREIDISSGIDNV